MVNLFLLYSILNIILQFLYYHITGKFCGANFVNSIVKLILQFLKILFFIFHEIIILLQEANFRQNCSSEIREPVQIRYPYHGDAMSEVDSEISVPLQKIPTPHFGESYSQSGCSPVMQRKTNANRFFPAGGESNAVIQNRSISEIDSRGGYSSTANSYKKYKSDEEDEDTEFVDNDAYMTFTRPKFEIIGSEEKGAVLETVQVKQH